MPARVLIIDDDPMLSEQLRSLLHVLGYPGICCADSRRALAITAECPFELIFCDYWMPGLNGRASTSPYAGANRSWPGGWCGLWVRRRGRARSSSSDPRAIPGSPSPSNSRRCRNSWWDSWGRRSSLSFPNRGLRPVPRRPESFQAGAEAVRAPPAEARRPERTAPGRAAPSTPSRRQRGPADRPARCRRASR